MSDDTHTWSMQKVDGSYADQTMKLVLIPTDSTTEETMHDLEGGVEALMEGDCTVVEDGETMSSISADGSCFDLHVGSGDDSTFTMNTAGISGLAIYAQHVPIEFERTKHYLKDSAGRRHRTQGEEEVLKGTLTPTAMKKKKRKRVFATMRTRIRKTPTTPQRKIVKQQATTGMMDGMMHTKKVQPSSASMLKKKATTVSHCQLVLLFTS